MAVEIFLRISGIWVLPGALSPHSIVHDFKKILIESNLCCANCLSLLIYPKNIKADICHIASAAF